MSKKQVIDYVMNSPANTNRAVLEGMLDGMGGADVPMPTAEDVGKILGVGNDGKYVLKEVSQNGSISVPIITQNTSDGSIWITEEEANKVFETAPLAFDLKQVIDGQADISLITFFRSAHKAEGAEEAQYVGTVEGADIVMLFQFEKLIGIVAMSQGQTIQQSTLTWNTTSKQYEALVQA